MTEEQINQIVDKITEIANNPTISTGTITGLSMNSANTNHYWTINTHRDTLANYSIKLDSLNDAISVIQKFSNDPKEDIVRYFQNKFSPNSENYLHYSKTPIGV